MAVKINSITGTWADWDPDTATNVVLSSVGGEKQIRWGVPLRLEQSGLGFFGSAPPQATVEVGEEFVVGRLRHFNQPIGVPPFVTDAYLEITILLDDLSAYTFPVQLNIEETDNTSGDPWIDRDFITVVGTLPLDLTNNGTTLRIKGFRDSGGNDVDVFESPEDSTTTAYLVAELVSVDVAATTIDPCSLAFDPVFTPAGCSVPPVCPIETRLILEDCDVPISPDPIYDCPDIDIPIAASLGIIGGIGVPPGGGGGGGCTPQIAVNYTVKYVSSYQDVGVTVTVAQIPPCNYVILFTFCIYRHPYFNDHDCCWWVWCPCEYASGPSSTSLDVLCPSGRWMLMDGTEAECRSIVPPAVGDHDNQVRITCPCPATTTETPVTSTEAPPTGCVPTNCDDVDPSGASFTIDSPGCVGCLVSVDGEMDWDDDFECFSGTFLCASGALVYVTLCCLSDGQWQISLFCGDDQRFDDTTLIDNGDGTWTATITWVVGDFPECCGGTPGDVVALTINGLYGSDCPAATTVAPPL